MKGLLAGLTKTKLKRTGLLTDEEKEKSERLREEVEESQKQMDAEKAKKVKAGAVSEEASLLLKKIQNEYFIEYINRSVSDLNELNSFDADKLAETERNYNRFKNLFPEANDKESLRSKLEARKDGVADTLKEILQDQNFSVGDDTSDYYQLYFYNNQITDLFLNKLKEKKESRTPINVFQAKTNIQNYEEEIKQAISKMEKRQEIRVGKNLTIFTGIASSYLKEEFSKKRAEEALLVQQAAVNPFSEEDINCYDEKILKLKIKDLDSNFDYQNYIDKALKAPIPNVILANILIDKNKDINQYDNLMTSILAFKGLKSEPDQEKYKKVDNYINSQLPKILTKLTLDQLKLYSKSFQSYKSIKEQIVIAQNKLPDPTLLTKNAEEIKQFLDETKLSKLQEDVLKAKLAELNAIKDLLLGFGIKTQISVNNIYLAYQHLKASLYSKNQYDTFSKAKKIDAQQEEGFVSKYKDYSAEDLQKRTKEALEELGLKNDKKERLFVQTGGQNLEVQGNMPKVSSNLTFPMGNQSAPVGGATTSNKVPSSMSNKMASLLKGKDTLQAKAEGNDEDLGKIVVTDLNKIDRVGSPDTTLLHVLCNNKQASATRIKETIEKLFEAMQNNYTFQPDLTHPEKKLTGKEAIENFIFRKDKNGENALHILSKNTRFKGEELKSLISTIEAEVNKVSSKNIFEELDHEKESLLMHLCKRDGSLDSIQYVCEKGIDINYAPTDSDGKTGFTAHYLAVINMFKDLRNKETEEIVKYLEEKGADINKEQNVTPEVSKNAAEYKQQRYNALSVNSLEDLIDALNTKSIMLKKLIDEDKGDEISNIIRSNPILLNMLEQNHNILCYAIEKGKTEIAKQLIANNMNLYGQDQNNKTPLEIANEKDNRKLIKALLDKYNEHSQDSLPVHLENSYTKSFVRAAAAAGAYLAQAPIPKNNVAQQTVAGMAAAAGGVVGGFLAWGAGRLGYEVYQAYNNKEDAYISGKFTTTWGELQQLESKSNMDEFKLAYLSDLEKEVMEEGKKTSPDLKKMHKTLQKSHILREEIFRDAKNQQAIIEKSNELIKNFKAWAAIQQGRDTSEAYTLVRNEILSCAAGVGAGAIGMVALNNSALAVPIATGAATVVTKALNKNQSTTNK